MRHRGIHLKQPTKMLIKKPLSTSENIPSKFKINWLSVILGLLGVTCFCWILYKVLKH